MPPQRGRYSTDCRQRPATHPQEAQLQRKTELESRRSALLDRSAHLTREREERLELKGRNLTQQSSPPQVRRVPVLSIIRWATYWIISRSRSASAPFSTSSASAILVLVVIVMFRFRLDGVVTPTLNQTHDDRLCSLRGPFGDRVCPMDPELRLGSEEENQKARTPLPGTSASFLLGYLN
jgi:hypothetical protein